LKVYKLLTSRQSGGIWVWRKTISPCGASWTFSNLHDAGCKSKGVYTGFQASKLYCNRKREEFSSGQPVQGRDFRSHWKRSQNFQLSRNQKSIFGVREGSRMKS